VINVASIPSLVKSLLLIKEEKGRNAVFSLSLLERILLCDQSVGSWLVPLLSSDSRFVQERAVEYLVMISSISTHKLNQQGPNNNGRRGSLQRLPSLANAGVPDRRKHDVYLAVEKQAGLEFAMLKLTPTAFEDAAATGVIQWVLDKKLFRPFTLFIIACDMIFLILIIAMFT
jgi:hypothetical protein